MGRISKISGGDRLRSVIDARISGAPHPIIRFGNSASELDLQLDTTNETLWCYLRPKDRPSFTPSVLQELIELRRIIQQLFLQRRPGEPPALKYFVGGSRIPGIYNMGGDFHLLLRAIRAGDREGLLRYARDCVDVAYHMWTGFDVPVITIALVQGDALGGGFEGALSFNVLVAERGTKFGLPEILFRLFPGMGAFSFLSRKLDAVRAERMIMGGNIFSAEELHELGLVDVLANKGEGESAVREYIAQNKRRHTVHEAIYQARRRVNPLAFEELVDVTRIWVDVALKLSDADLRKMERLMQAQTRRLAMHSSRGPQIR
jgi:DSF synthase